MQRHGDGEELPVTLATQRGQHRLQLVDIPGGGSAKLCDKDFPHDRDDTSGLAEAQEGFPTYTCPGIAHRKLLEWLRPPQGRMPP
jgi:hypothetical protein